MSDSRPVGARPRLSIVEEPRGGLPFGLLHKAASGGVAGRGGSSGGGSGALGPNCLNLSMPVMLAEVTKCSQQSMQGLEKLSHGVSGQVETWKQGGVAIREKGICGPGPYFPQALAGVLPVSVAGEWSSSGEVADASPPTATKVVADKQDGALDSPRSSHLSSPRHSPTGSRAGSKEKAPIGAHLISIAEAASRANTADATADTVGRTSEASAGSGSNKSPSNTSPGGRESRGTKGIEDRNSAEVTDIGPLGLEVKRVPEPERVSFSTGVQSAALGAQVGSLEGQPAEMETGPVVGQDHAAQEVAAAQGPEAGSVPKQATPKQKAKCNRCLPSLSFRSFPICSIHCPILFAGMIVLSVLACIGVLWPGMEIDTNLDTFLEADGLQNDLRSAFTAALSFRGLSGRDSGEERRLDSATDRQLGQHLRKLFRLGIMYRAPEDRDILDERMLSFIRDVELKLRDGPKWKNLCLNYTKGVTQGCETGQSLVNLVFAKPTEPPTGFENTGDKPKALAYSLTGRGRVPLATDVAMEIARKEGSAKYLFPKNHSANNSLMGGSLRTSYEFNMVCCNTTDGQLTRMRKLRELHSNYENFVATELYPTLAELSASEEAVELGVELFWEGTDIMSYEIFTALFSDATKAIGSMLFIIVYLTLHTRSPLLSTGALLLTMLSIPLAFVIASTLSGANRVTGASFLSLFFICGFGADVIIVYLTFWDITAGKGMTRPERLRHMYSKAGTACLATSLTTSASFFANLASVLRPLREFGFFMGLCILSAYLLLATGFPAVLILNDRVCSMAKLYCSGASGPMPSVLRDWMFGEADAGDGENLRPKRSRIRQALFFYIHSLLIPFRRWFCLISVAGPIILAAWALNVAEVAGDMPQMFPKGHNLREVEDVKSGFHLSPRATMSSRTLFCFSGAEPPSATERNQCDLFLCDLDAGRGDAWEPELQGEVLLDGSSATCKCKPTAARIARCERSRSPTISSRFVGLENIPRSFFSSSEWKRHVKELVSWSSGSSDGFNAQAGDSSDLGSVVQEHWESGTVNMKPYTMAFTTDSSNRQFCDVHEVCYCGVPACKLHTDTGAAWSTVTVPQERGRRLEDLDEEGSGMVPHSNSFSALVPSTPRKLLTATVDVSLIFGIEVKVGRPLIGDPSDDRWEFSKDFWPADPRVQRHMLMACRELKNKEDMLVVVSTCWMEDFKNWLGRSDSIFPVRSMEFSQKLGEFARSYVLPVKQSSVDDMMWFNLETGDLRAAMFQFDVAMSFVSTHSSKAIEQKKKWDEYVDRFNGRGPVESSMAWHTSKLWIRAEAEQAIVASTVQTLIVSVGFGFVGALVSTKGDLALSFMVVWSVAGVVITLAWFMVVLMDWDLGPIEVLGLIVFVGYSITYSLHIAHKYKRFIKEDAEGGVHADEVEPAQEEQKRRERAVAYSLEAMTSAVLGSALTTLGSSFFLFFCTMSIFVKLATVLFAVTLFAAVFALVALPAALACVGPLHTFTWCQMLRRAFESIPNPATIMEQRRAAQEQRRPPHYGGGYGGYSDEERGYQGPGMNQTSSTASRQSFWDNMPGTGYMRNSLSQQTGESDLSRSPRGRQSPRGRLSLRGVLPARSNHTGADGDARAEEMDGRVRFHPQIQGTDRDGRREMSPRSMARLTPAQVRRANENAAMAAMAETVSHNTAQDSASDVWSRDMRDRSTSSDTQGSKHPSVPGAPLSPPPRKGPAASGTSGHNAADRAVAAARAKATARAAASPGQARAAAPPIASPLKGSKKDAENVHSSESGRSIGTNAEKRRSWFRNRDDKESGSREEMNERMSIRSSVGFWR